MQTNVKLQESNFFSKQPMCKKKAQTSYKMGYVKNCEIQGSSQKLCCGVGLRQKNFNNDNSGEFCADS